MFTREFMSTLFRLLYTYQTLAREIVKEQYFQMRLEHFKSKDVQAYKQSVEKRNAALAQAQTDIKDIVFDYFNIISKEYELAIDKYKNDEEYKKLTQEVKSQVDEEFVDKRFEVPIHLTKEKTQELLKNKQ